MRVKAAVGVALLGSLLAAVGVRAALAFTFEPAAGSPGTVVVGRSIGDGSLSAAVGQAFPAYLVPTDQGIDAGVLLADVNVDETGNARLRFTVPRVGPGAYEVWVHCEPCAPTSAGRSDLPVGAFTVLAAPPPTDTEADPSTTLPLVLVGMLVVALLAQVYGPRDGRHRDHGDP